MPTGPSLVGAVDIGATKTLVTIAPFTPGRWGEPAGPPETISAVLQALGRAVRIPTDTNADRHADAVAEALRSAADGAPLAAVGVAAPGPLDPSTGLILDSPNLGWRRYPFGPTLAARVGAPVGLEDDANAGALAEAIAGAGAGADPVVFLTLSTGVGAGVVVGGRIVHGAHQAAGEVGHFTVDPSGPRCGCGGRGHVEAYVGGASLAARARAAWPDGFRADGIPAPRDAAGILAAARAGDPVAEHLVADAAEAVTVALAVLAAAVDPERIVVGGSLGLGQRLLVRRAVLAARRRVIETAGRGLTVVPAQLGALAPLAGAVVVALRSAHRAGTQLPDVDAHGRRDRRDPGGR